MSSTLVTIAALAAIAGNVEGELGGRLAVTGGAQPIEAAATQVAQMTLETTPRVAIRYTDGSSHVMLAFTPRFVQRFYFEGANPGDEPPPLTGPTQYYQGDLQVRWRPDQDLTLDASVAGGIGDLSFADAFLTAGGAATAPIENTQVAALSGRLGLSAITVPRGDTFSLGAEVASNFTLVDADSVVPTRDPTRFTLSSAYLFQPTPVDGFELAASGEVSLYPAEETPGGREAQTAAFAGATVGWVRQLSRRADCGIRVGMVVLFNDNLGLTPSASIDCSLITYQGPGLRVTTTLAGGIVGGTSMLDAVAEPRATGALDVRFTIIPDKAFALNVSYSSPLPTEDTVVPTPTSLLISAPFAWQFTPGVDLELGVRFGLRGVVDPGGNIPPGGSPFTNFGDAYEAQVFMGLAFAFQTDGENRRQR